MRKEVVLGVATLLFLPVLLAYAAVFTYYPGTLQVTAVSPPVVFEPGTNAGAPDLGRDNTIKVSIGDNKTSITLTIHPTYRVTYYKDVAVIENEDSKAYNVYVKVSQAITELPSGSYLYLYIYGSGVSRSLTGHPTQEPASGTYVARVDLTSTGTTSVGLLGGGSKYEVDVYVYIPEGTKLPTDTLTALFHLVYTPSGGTPP